MRKLTAALVIGLGLCVAPTDAMAAPSTTHATSSIGSSISSQVQGASTHATSDAQTLALGSNVAEKQNAQEPSKRRYTTKRRRNGLSRVFGFLGFLMCLPLLIVLIIALVFVTRRNRRRQQLTDQRSAPGGQYPDHNGRP